MYIPRHHDHIYPVITIMLGFFIRQQFGPSADVFFTASCLQIAGLMHSYYIVRAGILYQGYVTNTPMPKAPITNWHTREPVEDIAAPVEPGFIPMGRAGSVPILKQQVVTLPKFDKERNFAVTLLRMYEYDPKQVDLTEGRWVKPGKFIRDEFVAMLDNWEGHGLSGRKGKQRKRVVIDWRKVRLVANGNPLPRLPGK